MRRIFGFLVVSLLVLSAAAQSNDQKARVFITDSQSWQMTGNSGGANGAHGGHIGGGARPQTAEIIKTFGERCKEVVVNNKQDKADYTVVLDHEGGKSILSHDNKVAVFNSDGDAIVSHSTRSLGIEGEVAGILGFGLGGLFLLLVPILDRRTAQGRPGRLFTWIGIAIILYMLLFTALGYMASATK